MRGRVGKEIWEIRKNRTGFGHRRPGGGTGVKGNIRLARRWDGGMGKNVLMGVGRLTKNSRPDGFGFIFAKCTWRI